MNKKTLTEQMLRKCEACLRRLWWTAGCAIGLLLIFGTVVSGQVIAYEGNSFPELLGWEHELAGTPGADREISEDGWLVVDANLPDGWSEPTGDADYYILSLDDFVDVDAFFIEWRVVTDAPSYLFDYWALPVGVAIGGNGPLYQTGVTDGRVRLLRGLTLPIIFVDVEAAIPHVYRLEVYGADTYKWHVDGEVVERGIPEGPYPDPGATFTWGVRRWYVDATTAWDFVRAGVIPTDGGGDYDSDGATTLADQYFVQDCLTKDGPGIFGGPGANAGPGCRFADFDSDSDVDLLDFAEFANEFSGNHP